jgi:polyhydroxyalkanoate synthesis regulator phasin
LLGILPALFSFILTPVGALTTAIYALYAAHQDYAASGAVSMEWFGRQFEALKTHVKPAIEGIKNALKAGDLQLAFEILWVQIKLSFAEGIQPLRKAWEDYAYFFKHVWNEASYSVESAWNTRTNNMAQNITSVMQKLGYYTEEEGNAMRDGLVFDLKATLDKLKAEHDKAVESNLDEYNKSVRNITKDLDELMKERKELTDKAKDEAAKEHPMPVVPKLDPNKFKPPDQKMKVTPVVHWEAALAEGAEALSRVMAYQAGIQGRPRRA